MASTRSTTDVFMVGHSSPEFPSGFLPTNLDILREALWKKELFGGNKPLNDMISCPIANKQGVWSALCSEKEGCLQSEKDKYCTLQKIKQCWNQAGIKYA